MEENFEKESKGSNKFLTGLLIGIIVSCIIAIIGNYIGIRYLDKKYKETYGDLTSSTVKIDENQTNSKLNAIYRIIDSYFLNEYTQDELSEGIYKGFVAALGDPYSVYYTKQEYLDMMESSSGVYCGIGVMISQSASTGIMTITKVFPNGPGAVAGLLPNDILTKAAGVSTEGMDLSTIVSYIKGEEGTPVEIEVYRSSVSDYVTLTVERKKVEVPTVESEMLEDNIGYIALSGFEEVTANQFKAALEELKKSGAKGLIVDLRDNGGGLLSVVNDILRNILPKGVIVYTIDKNGRKVTYDCDGNNELDIPMVVLTNGSSASASEIFAGAVKDYNKATLVGTNTFGKGIVQTVIPLSDGSAVKVTVSKYYTPNGVNIHGTGIAPDVEVELDKELKYLITIPHDQDNQLQKGIEVLKEKIK